MFLPLGDDVTKRTMPLVGSFLVAVNVLVYAYELRLVFDTIEKGHVREFIDFVHEFGLVPKDFAQGKMVGVFTYMFLHGGFMHLLGNMVVLWAFVHTLEETLGQINFLFYYLLWGVVAGLAHALAQPGSEIPMVGASGAIAGMIGAYFIAFGALTKIKCVFFIFLKPWRIDLPAGAFVGFWFLSQIIGLAGESEDQTAGVAWYAHLGGFAIGAVTMLIAGKTDRKVIRNRHGELEVIEIAGQEAADAAGLQPHDDTAGKQQACPYCGTPFTKESAIASSLLKCNNPDCERLTYISG